MNTINDERISDEQIISIIDSVTEYMYCHWKACCMKEDVTWDELLDVRDEIKENAMEMIKSNLDVHNTMQHNTWLDLRTAVGYVVNICFPNAYIVRNKEVIVDKQANSYFCLSDLKTVEDLSCKILSALSRDAYKTEPFDSPRRNEKFHQKILDGINRYFGAQFTFGDMEKIYSEFGNGANATELRRFVQNNCDMSLLK